MKIIGQILLWAGFLSGSLATVFHAPQKGVEAMKQLTPKAADEAGFALPDLSAVIVPEEGWGLIPWGWYAGSVMACVFGIVAIRMGKSSESQKSEKSQMNLGELEPRLSNVIENVGKIAKSIEQVPPSQIAKQIDDLLADDLRIFADGRDSVAKEYGLEVFADMMTQFAAGERAINRAWSASADGYVDEATMCLERAIELLSEARRVLCDAGKS